METTTAGIDPILHAHEWDAHGGYYPHDGVEYRSCRRCGINMAVSVQPDGSVPRKFCRDCNYPMHTRWYG